MMKINELLATFNYEVEEGYRYLWDCFGDDAWGFAFDNVSVVFNKKTGELLTIDTSVVGDDDKNFFWINPTYEVAYREEATRRKVTSLVGEQVYSLKSIVTMATDCYNGVNTDLDLANYIDLLLNDDLVLFLQAEADKHNTTIEEVLSTIINDFLKDMVEHKGMVEPK